MSSPGPLALVTEGVAQPVNQRLKSGGPAGQAPLIKAVRMKQPELRRVVTAWLDRCTKDVHAALAELMSLVVVVADVPNQPMVEKDDVRDQDPVEVTLELVAKVAVEASEKGADFTQHWLVSREKGSVRVRENYPALWREFGVSVPGQKLLGGLLHLLRNWLLALADCQFRSVRHAATMAGLQLVEGLSIQCLSLHSHCESITVQAKDAQVQGATLRLQGLSTELSRATGSARDLSAARDALGVALLSRRTKDVDLEIRRCCFESMKSWAHADPQTFLGESWTRYLHFGLYDRDAKARNAVLAAILELLGSPMSASVKRLAEGVCPRVLERCHDVDAAVGASALRCASALAGIGFLPDKEIDEVVELVWDADSERRGEAVTFVSRFIFSEDILDYSRSDVPPGGLLPTVAENGAATRARVLMLVEFMNEYGQGHHVLVERLVSALWGRSSCLEDWEVFASLALPGSEYALQGEQHRTMLMHLMEAVASCATADASAQDKPQQMERATAVLDRAARAMVARIPSLLEACQPSPPAALRAARLCRHLLRHCATPRVGGGSLAALVAGPLGKDVARVLSEAFLRLQDPDTLEYVAEGLAYLLDLSSCARAVVQDLAAGLRGSFLDVAPALSASQQGEHEAPNSDEVFSLATRLRILAKAYDVSLCDVRSFCACCLSLLDDRAAALEEEQTPIINAQLALALLELLALLLTRHMAAFLQPEPLARCVAHDPVNQEELQVTPTAANDLCTVTSHLIRVDCSPQVRTAAFAACVAVLTVSWNASRFANSAVAGMGSKGPEWVLDLTDELRKWLSEHLGAILAEANNVPKESNISGPAPEPGNAKEASAFSQLFSSLRRSVALAAANGENETTLLAAVSDSERVRTGVLACALVASCRHPGIERSHLPHLVLTQALSVREDMQEAAWMLLRRIRKESRWDADRAESFFSALLGTVRLVHADAGEGVARDISFRLMHRVAVGKLTPTLQVGLVAALRKGASEALVANGRGGFLKALVPWVTRHIVEDALLEDLASWAAEQVAEQGGDDPDGLAVRSGLSDLLKACLETARRGSAAVEAAPGSAGAGSVPATPNRNRPPPVTPSTSGGAKRRRKAAGQTPQTPPPREELRSHFIPQPRVLGPSL